MKAEWLEIAKNLPCGGKVKVHCCGNSPSMLISHRENGYSTHCFRCNEPDSHAFVPHGQRSIGEIHRHRRELKAEYGKPPRLPSDFTRTIPGAYMWFLKYGISVDRAIDYGFGWSEFFQRIVIPIYNLVGKLTAVHLRAVREGDKPKYLNLGTPDKDVCFYAPHPNDSFVVVTEDILSAIKINMAGFYAVSILGSDITDVQVQRIMAISQTVLVWLDNDAAGHKGAKDAVKQFTMQGCRLVLRVQSEADPKTYNKEQIVSLIKEAR